MTDESLTTNNNTDLDLLVPIEGLDAFLWKSAVIAALVFVAVAFF